MRLTSDSCFLDFKTLLKIDIVLIFKHKASGVFLLKLHRGNTEGVGCLIEDVVLDG
jgi:hypothetical protein